MPLTGKATACDPRIPYGWPVSVLTAPHPIQLSAYGLSKQYKMAEVFGPLPHILETCEEISGFGLTQP